MDVYYDGDHTSAEESKHFEPWSNPKRPDELGTEVYPSHKNSLPQKGQPTAGTASENSSIRHQLTKTSLEDSHISRRARKRSNDDPTRYPFKQQQTDASRQRTPSQGLPVGSLGPANAHAQHGSSPQDSKASNSVASPGASHSSDTGQPGEFRLLKQPITRPISEQQLINEVKGIYAGLVMVETKCVEIVGQQSQSNKRLENQQWKALVALHRTLLQEHHDFFSASQHPTASGALKRLAIKYAMPARMWRHGIHAFLELLRHRLPDSMEHMLNFIYLSYSMMALLKESVPSFVETWIECLGDLARYRMAIEDSDPRDREIWSNVARMWYNEAADKSPYVGRIQHHLAVLARPNIVEQLFYYTKALVSVVPFTNARESIMLLFDMFVKNNEQMKARYLVADLSFVNDFAILFTRGSIREFYEMQEQFLNSFSGHMDRAASKFKLQGPQIAMSLLAGMIDFARDDSRPYKMYQKHLTAVTRLKNLKYDVAEKELKDKEELKPAKTLTEEETKIKEDEMRRRRAELALTAENEARDDAHRYGYEGLTRDVKPKRDKTNLGRIIGHSQITRAPDPPSSQSTSTITSSDQVVALAGEMFYSAVSKVASRMGDKNIIPFMHCVLASLWGWSFVPKAFLFIETYVPWQMIATFLNTIGRSGTSHTRFESAEFPESHGGSGRQLPEDFLLRGFMMTQHYYPVGFWSESLVDEDERAVELPSHQAPRAERCLWLGQKLSTLSGRYFTYDKSTQEFACTKLAESFRSS